MNVRYDKDVDTLYIRLADIAIEESAEIEPGLIVDLSLEGDVIGVEVLNASHRADVPRTLPFGGENYASFLDGVRNKSLAISGNR